MNPAWIVVGAGLLLCGCAGLPLTEREQLEAGGRIAGSILTGDYVGAAGQTVDLALILLGLKGVQKAGGWAKRKARETTELFQFPEPPVEKETP